MSHASGEVERIADAHPKPYARILTDDDIPFVQDGLRDGEHLRHTMQQRFRDIVSDPQRRGAPWIEVSGSVEQRLETALAFLRTLGATP